MYNMVPVEKAGTKVVGSQLTFAHTVRLTAYWTLPQTIIKSSLFSVNLQNPFLWKVSHVLHSFDVVMPGFYLAFSDSQRLWMFYCEHEID